MTHTRIRATIPLVLLVGAGGFLMRLAAERGERPAGPIHLEGAAAESPAPGTRFLYPERIPLQDEEFVEAERGMMFVPVNRSDPKGEVIGVEIYRFRASGGARVGTPPVFLLHGGPGWPGLAGSLKRPGYYEERIRPLTEISDLVVVGQRGIGSSKPNTICEPSQEFPLDAEVSEEEAAAAIQEMSAKCRAHWEGTGLDLSGLTVIEAAGDVNDVRKALGYDKITISGGSFGSHWGMAVMRYYPDIVERAVLTGMEGPDHTYDMPSWVLNSLTRIAAAAEEAPELEGLIPEGGLIEALKTVIARVEEEPVEVTVPHPETGEPQTVRFDVWHVRRMALGYSGRVSGRQGMRTWPSDVLALYAGDFTKAAEAAIRRRSGDDPDLNTASYFMLDCGSGISPEREAELDADPAAEIVGPLGWWYQTSCPPWKSDLGDEFRTNFETEIPTVIVHGNWDVSTPFDNALELAPFFKNSKLVVVKGGSHGALGEAMRESEAFRAALMKFAETGDMSALPSEVELPPVEWVVPEQATSAATE